MALTIEEGQKLFDVVNERLNQFLAKLATLQVYIDDWSLFTREQKSQIKARIASQIDAQINTLNDLKTYINTQ